MKKFSFLGCNTFLIKTFCNPVQQPQFFQPQQHKKLESYITRFNDKERS
jgi:hypothetical protein